MLLFVFVIVVLLCGSRRRTQQKEEEFLFSARSVETNHGAHRDLAIELQSMREFQTQVRSQMRSLQASVAEMKQTSELEKSDERESDERARAHASMTNHNKTTKTD
jgi:hypothetical protein